MECPNCNREMVPLFTSFVCDYCDGLVSGTDYYRGYIVCRGPEEVRGRQVYVFRTREDAERWRSVRNLHDHRICEVLSEHDIKWRQSRGSVKDLELADRLFEIYPDHRFEPKPNRAFIAPEELACTI